MNEFGPFKVDNIEVPESSIESVTTEKSLLGEFIDVLFLAFKSGMGKSN
jgi:hypothetical protein